MPSQAPRSVIKVIAANLERLTPKGKILGNFIIQNPRKAVFMTTRELAESCGVSEATVVRFVGHLGYERYVEFLQALRDYVDTGLSLPDRIDLPGMQGPGVDRLHRVLVEEMGNLRQLCEQIDLALLEQFVEHLRRSEAVYVVGSRISYTYAYYLGWSLTKVRKGVHILNGSDSTTIDWLNNAPQQSLVLIFTIARYPNDLIRVSKVARRLGHTLLAITDSNLCPLIPFAQHALVAPTKGIPLIGYATAISCIIDYLVLELASRNGTDLRQHQDRLEQLYRENDILFDTQTEMITPR
jgi:DNA-binding MurR/RpiR family transcriptional regulator